MDMGPIDYQNTVYYSAPKKLKKSMDEVDPELLATYEKLGIPMQEQRRSGRCDGSGCGVRQRVGCRPTFKKNSWVKRESSFAVSLTL